MTLYKWSQTASADATADSTINWAEGQAPSSINDSARAMMAATAKYRDDIAGAIITSGTSTAYSLSSFQLFDTLTHLNGQMIAFTPHVTNGATVTLNVDSLGAKPLRSAPNTELLAGTIIQGTPYVATYNNNDGAFYLHGFFGNPYNIPLAAGLDYWAPTAPNTSFAFPVGQAISRTTYSALFALIGTTYGTGDGSSTFNLPDKTGRVSVMKEASVSRLTGAGFGGNSTQMGAVGGVEKQTLATANLPPYTPSGAITNGAINISGGTLGGTSTVPDPGPGSVGVLTGAASIIITQNPSTFTGTPQGGTSAPIATVPPMIICNYIIRII
jgi:microcystin-dependent protein